MRYVIVRLRKRSGREGVTKAPSCSDFAHTIPEASSPSPAPTLQSFHVWTPQGHLPLFVLGRKPLYLRVCVRISHLFSSIYMHVCVRT